MVKNSKLLTFFRLIVLFISLAILYQLVDFSLVLAHVKLLQWYILPGIVLISIFRTWLTGIRWQLLNPDITGQLSKWQYFRFLMISNVYNLIMPGALGGDFVRAAITVGTVKEAKAHNLIAIFVDRFIGLLSIMLLGSIAFLFSGDIPARSSLYPIFIILYAAVGMALFLFTNGYTFKLLEEIASRLGRLGDYIKLALTKWVEALRYFRAHKTKVFFGFLICIPVHLTSFITTYVLALNLGINISFFSLSMVFALVWVITSVPLTLSGAGLRELSLIYLLSFYGVGAEQATALSIYLYIIMLLVGLIGLFFIIDWSRVGSQMIKSVERVSK